MKYPLLRLGHFPERYLRKKLYLDFSNGDQPRYTAPDFVEIPEEHRRPELPGFAVLQQGAGTLPRPSDLYRP
jgi:hypothetical protein